MEEPIEETLIMPQDFDEFSVVFPGIYRKISEHLNKSPYLYKKRVRLTPEASQVYAFGFFTQPQEFAYAFYGESKTEPHEFGVGLYFPDGAGISTSIFKSPNAQFRVITAPGELLASVASGVQDVYFRLLFL